MSVIAAVALFGNAHHLGLEDFVLHSALVVLNKPLFELVNDLRVLFVVHHIQPRNLANEETSHWLHGFIDEKASLVESYRVSSDNIFLVEQDELFLFVDRKPYLVGTSHWEDDLSELIQLIKQHSIRFVPNWFKAFGQIHNEVAVYFVSQRVSRVLAFFWQSKYFVV